MFLASFVNPNKISGVEIFVPSPENMTLAQSQSTLLTGPNMQNAPTILGRKPRLVCVVTISMSTKFFEGQLAYLVEHGFDGFSTKVTLNGAKHFLKNGSV